MPNHHFPLTSERKCLSRGDSLALWSLPWHWGVTKTTTLPSTTFQTSEKWVMFLGVPWVASRWGTKVGSRRKAVIVWKLFSCLTKSHLYRCRTPLTLHTHTHQHSHQIPQNSLCKISRNLYLAPCHFYILSSPEWTNPQASRQHTVADVVEGPHQPMSTFPWPLLNYHQKKKKKKRKTHWVSVNVRNAHLFA